MSSGRVRTEERDPKDWILPPSLLISLSLYSRALARHHLRLFEQVPPRSWWQILLGADMWWYKQREWHDTARREFEHYNYYFEHCSNSRSQVEYLGGDIAWECESQHIDRFLQITDCVAKTDLDAAQHPDCFIRPKKADD